MPTSVKELEAQVNASRKLIRKFLVEQCGAVMEHGKQFVVTDEQASLVANHFGPRTIALPERLPATEQKAVVLEELASLREEKARLEERVKGLDSQILLYQEQVSDLREQLRIANDALRVANESICVTSRALEEANASRGIFGRLFGRKRLQEKND